MGAKKDTFKQMDAYLMNFIDGLKWFDKDKQQFEDIDNNVMPLPAVLMSFGRTPYENQGENIKHGNVNIRFRIGFENYADSYTGSINQDKALEFFDFNEAVFSALQGLDLQYVKNLDLTADEDDVQNKNVIVTVLEFSGTLIIDTSNVQSVTPGLKLNPVKEVARPPKEENTFFYTTD